MTKPKNTPAELHKPTWNQCRVISRPADPPRSAPLEAVIEEVSGGQYRIEERTIAGLTVLVVVKNDEKHLERIETPKEAPK